MLDNILNISFDGINFDAINLNFKTNIIGHGGNGNVYLLKIDGKKTDYVVKVLKPFRKSKIYENRFKRFKKEISKLSEFTKQELLDNSILPIIYPAKENIDVINQYKAYYVMPKANPYNKVDKLFDLFEICNILTQILKALKFLHKNNLAHRDIKIDNILNYNRKWVLSDFGLVISEEDFKLCRLTQEKEMVGPRGMPDELRYACKDKEIDIETFKKSDIYLYGKLCWQLLTHNYNSFEGILLPCSGAIKELQEVAYNKYDCPILPLLEMMQRTICLLPEERANLDFIETCLNRQIHLIESHNNEEYTTCYEQQKLFFNLYSKKSYGYFSDNASDIISILDNLTRIHIILYRNNFPYEYVVKFDKIIINNDLSNICLILKDINTGNTLFYIKPKRIEIKNISIQTITLDNFNDVEKMNLRFQDERFDENKLLSFNDYIEINCFGN